MFQVKDGSTKGVVNDWDMASILNDEGEVPTSTAKHRTGTIPFMARDLLESDPPPHLYRHDLESFFYLLVWSTIHYDLKNKVRLPVCQDLARWDSNDPLAASAQKWTFIINPLTAKKVFTNIRDEFKSLLSEWVFPLHQLFQTATFSLPNFLDVHRATHYDYDTYDGRLTFHTFMEALSVTPRSHSNTRVENR